MKRTLSDITDVATHFSDWPTLVVLTVSAIVLYPFLIFALRVAGKRAVGNLNNFDWVVTVALGSVFASAAVVKEFRVLDAVMIISVLLSAQWLITWLTSRSAFVSRLVKSEPTVLVLLGELKMNNVRSVRVSKDEIYAAARKSGHASVSTIAMMSLESNSEISVIGFDTSPGVYDAIEPLLSEDEFAEFCDRLICPN